MTPVLTHNTVWWTVSFPLYPVSQTARTLLVKNCGSSAGQQTLNYLAVHVSPVSVICDPVIWGTGSPLSPCTRLLVLPFCNL